MFARFPLVSGVVVGAICLLPHALLPRDASLALAAVLIALIAGIYFGFAVVNGSWRDQLVEFNVSGLFAAAGVVGLVYWPPLLPLAYFAHAAWDFAHHHRAALPLVTVPRWYVPWCVVIDVIIGAGLLVLWRREGIVRGADAWCFKVASSCDPHGPGAPCPLAHPACRPSHQQ